MAGYGPLLVILMHAAALLLAYLTLYFLHPKAWYWHAAAVASALWIGLTRMPEEQCTAPCPDMTYSLAFAFLLLWGVAGPVFEAAERSGGEKSA